MFNFEILDENFLGGWIEYFLFPFHLQTSQYRSSTGVFIDVSRKISLFRHGKYDTPTLIYKTTTIFRLSAE